MLISPHRGNARRFAVMFSKSQFRQEGNQERVLKWFPFPIIETVTRLARTIASPAKVTDPIHRDVSFGGFCGLTGGGAAEQTQVLLDIFLSVIWHTTLFDSF